LGWVVLCPQLLGRLVGQGGTARSSGVHLERPSARPATLSWS